MFDCFGWDVLIVLGGDTGKVSPLPRNRLRLCEKIEYICAIVREAINIQYIVNSCRPRRRRAASRETFPKVLVVSVLVFDQKPLKEPFLNLFLPSIRFI